MRWAIGWCVALVVFAGPWASARADFSDPMTFSYGGTGGHCDRCRWILAEGVFEADTAERFRTFISMPVNQFSAPPGPDWTVRFNSPGGNLLSALSIGLMIRQHQWNTSVGPDEYYNQPAGCYSACTYAFLGGISRRVAEGAPFGIHQFYDPAAVSRYAKKVTTEQDIADMRAAQGALVSYVRSMGADPTFVELASQTQPLDKVHLLTSQDLASLGIDNSQVSAGGWNTETWSQGLTAHVRQPQFGKYQGDLRLYCVRSGFFMSFYGSPANAILAPGGEAYDGRHVALFVDNLNLSAAIKAYSGLKRSGNVVYFQIGVDPKILAAMTAGREIKVQVDLPQLASGWSGVGGTFPLVNSETALREALRGCN
jgi:hypothetical protein